VSDTKKIKVCFETTKEALRFILDSAEVCPGYIIPGEIDNEKGKCASQSMCVKCTEDLIDRITVKDSHLTKPTNIEKLWAYARDRFFENAYSVIVGAVRDHSKIMEDLDEDLAGTILNGLRGGDSVDELDPYGP
jgi:hypothetical protein